MGERGAQATLHDALTIPERTMLGQALLEQGGGTSVVPSRTRLHRGIDQQPADAFVLSQRTAQRTAPGKQRGRFGEIVLIFGQPGGAFERAGEHSSTGG